MGQLNSNSGVGTYAADYQYRANQSQTDKTQTTEKKCRVYGRTIGNPELSETAKKYYEELKKKYSNMDFILVSPDKKEEAERNKGMYASSKELLVLIDSDKIERMATDEAYRAKYEAILNGATAQVAQMKQELGSNADRVSSIGMSFDDHGNASFFAVIDKSLAKQKERIEEKRAEAREKRKEASKEAAEERLEASRKNAEKTEERRKNPQDYVTITATSWEELLKKIDALVFEERADSVMTENEKKVGQSIDYSV